MTEDNVNLPTTEQVRAWCADATDMGDVAFDRWLADHDRDIRERVKDEILAAVDPDQPTHWNNGLHHAARIVQQGGRSSNPG